MQKKYELTSNTIVKFGRTLYQIKALFSFDVVSKGDFGGYIENEENLSQDGNAWVFGDAWVSDNAEVSGNACVSGNAWVYGNAKVYGDAWISGNAKVYGDAWISGNARVFGNAWVYGNAKVYGDAWISGNARVFGNADFLLIGRIGSRAAFTTFFKNKSAGITVACGCFLGTIAEFREKVKETHGNNKHAKMYNLAADMAELQILTKEE